MRNGIKHFAKYLPQIILSILAISFVFYWYEIRPTKIKHDCSWIKKYSDAVPEKKETTEEQLRQQGMLKDCTQLKWNSEKQIYGHLDSLFENRDFCEDKNKEVIEENQYKPYIPAKEWFVKATDEEYKFCLHDKGL